MYKYIPKSSAQKSENSNSSHDVMQTHRQPFLNSSANQNSNDSHYLLDEKFHEKLFGKPSKAEIFDNAGNGANRLPTDDCRAHYNSDKSAQMRAYVKGTDNRSECKRSAREPIIQRLLDSSTLNRRKKANIIEARNFWNEVYNQLYACLPATIQGEFKSAVEDYEQGLADQNTIPEDHHFLDMVNIFARVVEGYLRAPHDVGSLEDAALNARGSVHVAKNTGGHENTQTMISVPVAGGGCEFFRTGETRLHGKKVENKKEYRKRRERDEKKDSLIIEERGIAFGAAQAVSLLNEKRMPNAATALHSFITNI